MNGNHAINQATSQGITEQTFDPQKHTWCGYFSSTPEAWERRELIGHGQEIEPGEVYKEIEETLRQDEHALLKQAITRETGIIDPRIGGLKITIVNRGNMQVITRVDVGIQNDQGHFVNAYPFIVILTLHNSDAARQYSAKDYQTIAKCRKDEAAALGYTEDNSKYDRRLATFPAQYGEMVTPSGYHLQLTRYMEGFHEVNMLARQGTGSMMGDTLDRHISINEFTQRGVGRILDTEESHAIARKIMVHQFTAAVRSKVVLNPSFSAGDYLWSTREERLVLHTAPERDFDRAGSMWKFAVQNHPFPLGDRDPKIVAAAHQLLTMIMTREYNLTAMVVNSEGILEDYPTYSLWDVIGFGEALANSNMLMPEEWKQVFKTMKAWSEHIYNDMLKMTEGMQDMDAMRALPHYAIGLLSFSRENLDRVNACVQTMVMTLSMRPRQ